MSSVFKEMSGDLRGGPVVKNLPFKAGDIGSIPGPGCLMACDTAKLKQNKVTHAVVVI